MKDKLHFTLVGRCKEKDFFKHMPKGWNNADNLGSVLDKINLQFGNRPVAIIDRAKLINDSNKYPDFFAAGWFISDDGTKELVVLDHGVSMETARKSLLNSLKNLNWDELATRTS